jgi:hypothetical protein
LGENRSSLAATALGRIDGGGQLAGGDVELHGLKMDAYQL